MSQDKLILAGIANNSELFDAVKKVVLEQFEEKPYPVDASDELLGQITRARCTGRQKVEEAFRTIAAYRNAPKTDAKENPAY